MFSFTFLFRWWYGFSSLLEKLALNKQTKNYHQQKQLDSYFNELKGSAFSALNMILLHNLQMNVKLSTKLIFARSLIEILCDIVFRI